MPLRNSSTEGPLSPDLQSSNAGQDASAGRVDERSDRPTEERAHEERLPGPSRLDRIAKRARELYEARGGQHGHDVDDWLQAEREIDLEAEQPTERSGTKE